jgi:hypothetical protein
MRPGHDKYGGVKRATFKKEKNPLIAGTADICHPSKQLVPTVSIHERQIQNQMAELRSSVRRFRSVASERERC